MRSKKSDTLGAGKLPPELLERLLNKVRTHDPGVVLGPAIGEDAAVVRIGRKLLIAKK